MVSFLGRVLLGAISFRLNDKHKFKDNNKKQRGKKTIAKDRMYRYILSKIKNLTPEIYCQYFDPKKSTPTLTNDGVSRIVSDKYRHWIMISKSNLGKYFNNIEEKKRRYLTAYPKDLANRTSET